MPEPLPTPPPGFRLESDIPPPPSGFIVEDSSIPEPPPGFRIENERKMDSLVDIFAKSRLGRLGQAAAGAVRIAAPILEPLRTPTVGLGGIAAGVKAARAGAPALPAASESIEERRGLGRELVSPFIGDGLGQDLSALVAEIATDPLTYAGGTIISRLGKAIGASKPGNPAIIKVVADVVTANPNAAETLQAEAKVPGNPLAKFYLEKKQIEREIITQDVALKQFRRKNPGELTKGMVREIELKEKGLRKSQAELSAIREQISEAKANAKLKPVLAEAEGQAFRESLAGKTPAQAVEAVAEPRPEISSSPASPLPPPTSNGFHAAVGERVDRISKKIADAADALDGFSNEAKIAIEHINSVSATGTLPEGVRPDFRLTKPTGSSEADIQAFAVSKKVIQAAAARVINIVREYDVLKSQIEKGGDLLSANTAKALGESLTGVEKRVNATVEQFRITRFSVNRAMLAFNEAIPKDVIETLRRSAGTLAQLKEAKERLPITTNIAEGLKAMGVDVLRFAGVAKPEAKGFSAMRSSEKSQFWHDVINQVKLNLFSPLSFTLDMITNATELAAQGAGHLGNDLVRVAQNGEVSFHGVAGLLRSGLRHTLSDSGIPAQVKDLLETTAAGEKINLEYGTFTRRMTPLSTFFDYLVGAPLYAKGIMDNAAKRVGSMAYIYREAARAADAAGVVGAQARKAFFDKYLADIPIEVTNKALEYGNKAGFNRPLSHLEERYGSSKGVTLFVDTFARWPFQFSRWGAEMLGYHPGIMSKGPAEVGEYLAKTATGWGGLYLMNQTLYDRVDFNTMEYVHPDGGRSRLSNRDPMTTGLFFLAVMKGDKERALAALQFASIPLAKVIAYDPAAGASAGAGGLLSGVISQFQQLASTKQNNPRRIADEWDAIINKLIPGQAMMGLMKTIFDPTVRRGIGAGVPFYSKRLSPVINATTGEPLVPMQQIPVVGTQVPSILGTPFPGAKRVLNPIEKLLFRYGFSVNRGLRTSIAGVPANNVPDNVKDEWLINLGKQRQILLGRLAADSEDSARLNETDPDTAREIISSLDNSAAELATTAIESKYGITIEKPEFVNRKKSAGPVEYEKFRGRGASNALHGDQLREALRKKGLVK